MENEELDFNGTGEEETGSDELLADDNLRLPERANVLVRVHAVRAWLDVRYGARDGVPIAEFSWEGVDEGDRRSGRGWAGGGARILRALTAEAPMAWRSR